MVLGNETSRKYLRGRWGQDEWGKGRMGDKGQKPHIPLSPTHLFTVLSFPKVPSQVS